MSILNYQTYLSSLLPESASAHETNNTKQTTNFILEKNDTRFTFCLALINLSPQKWNSFPHDPSWQFAPQVQQPQAFTWECLIFIDQELF